MRLRGAGAAIALDPRVRGTHLKRWSLGSMVSTDLRRRGIPWMRLQLEAGEAVGSAQPRLAPPAQRARGGRGGRSRRSPGAAAAARSRPLGAMVGAQPALLRPAPAARRRARWRSPGVPLHLAPPPHRGLRGDRRASSPTRSAASAEGAAVSAPPLRLGLVGCGRLAELGYVPAFARVEERRARRGRRPGGRPPEPDRRHGRSPRGAAQRSHAERRRAARRGGRRGAGDRQPAGRAPAPGASSRPAPGLPALVEKPPALAARRRRAARGAAPGAVDRLQPPLPARRAGCSARLPADGAARARARARLPAPLVAAADRRRGRAHRPRARTSSTWRWCSRAPDGARVTAARVSRARAELELETTRGRARIRCANDRPHRERVSARGAGGRRLATHRRRRPAGGAHQPPAGPRAPAGRVAARPARGLRARGRAAASPGLLASAEDGARVMRVIDEARSDRPAAAGDVICVLQFDAASVAALDRLLAAGRLPNLAALLDARAAASSSRRRRPTSPPAPSTRSTAGSSSATTGSSIRSSGRRPSSARATRPRSTRRRRSGSGSPSRACGRWRSIRTRAGRRAAPRGSSSAAGASPTGSCCRAGRGPRTPAARFARRHGRGPEATEIFGRPRPRDLLAPAREAGRGARAGSRRWPRSCSRASASTSPGSRSAPPTSRATSSGTSRSSIRQALDPGTRATLETALDDVYAAVDDALGRVLAALPPGADVIVTSAVGMDVNTSRADLLPEMLAAVLAGGPADDERRRGDLAAARGDARRPARRAVAGALPRPRGARAHRPARAPRARLGDDAGLRPPGRQPGLRPAQPPRPRARRDRRPGRGRRAARRDRGRPRHVHRPRRRARRSRAWSAPSEPVPGRARRPAPRPRRPLVRAPGDHARDALARRGSARCGATGAARAARATTRRATPGRWWCRGRARSRSSRARRGSSTSRRRSARSPARTVVAYPGSRCCAGRAWLGRGGVGGSFVAFRAGSAHLPVASAEFSGLEARKVGFRGIGVLVAELSAPRHPYPAPPTSRPPPPPRWPPARPRPARRRPRPRRTRAAPAPRRTPGRASPRPVAAARYRAAPRP